MTRYIDADALLKELKKSCEYHAENSRELSLLQRDIIIVQEQPTVDAVPVIRCKDCMHRIATRNRHGQKERIYCRLFFDPIEHHYYRCKDGDFCSRAEKK